MGIKKERRAHLCRELGRHCSDGIVEVVNTLMPTVLILIHSETERFQNCAKLSDKMLMEL